jgi:hypothetical protein
VVALFSQGQLVVLPPLHYTQIIQIYPLIIVSCWGMLLLLSLWWLRLTTFKEEGFLLRY